MRGDSRWRIRRGRGALLVRERSDVEVVLLEKEPELARHQTGRNSGVVHAGLYYEPGSLKSRLCRRGGELIRKFCAEHDLPYDECGKVLVASEEADLPRLEQVVERAQANGAEVRPIDARELRESSRTRPASQRSTASNGDRRLSGGLRRAREREESAEAVRTSAAVKRHGHGRAPAPRARGGNDTRRRPASSAPPPYRPPSHARPGSSAAPRTPFRGEYWRLRPERSHLVRGLVYPVPDPSLPFLGVHLTRTVDESVLVGRTRCRVAREGYRRRTSTPVHPWDTVSWPGMWRVAARHRHSRGRGRAVAQQEGVRPRGASHVPELTVGDAARSRGVQAVDRDARSWTTSASTSVGTRFWVRNAPSPAATSSLAIAEELVSYLGL